MSSDKQAYPADEVGMLLHTALRKLCDSRESSYLWNIIHVVPQTWRAFCQAVVAAEARTGDELHAVAEDQEAWWSHGREGSESFYARQVFRIALEDFGREDTAEWDGFAGYLSEEA